MTINVTDIAEQIHRTAREKGFWDTERNMGEMFMLTISELAEALEAHRNGDSTFYLEENGKPEGTVVELADAVIRCLDALQYNWDLPDTIAERMAERRKLHDASGDIFAISENFGENLLKISDLVCRSKRHYLWLIDVVVMCERLVESMDHDIWAAVRIKMEYNTTRPYKHGKAY